METLKNTTGKTRTELESIYIESVNMMVKFGATKEQARKIAKQTLRDTLGLN